MNAPVVSNQNTDSTQVRAFIREQQWGGSVATHYQTFRSIEAMRAHAAKYPQDEIVSFEEVAP